MYVNVHRQNSDGFGDNTVEIKMISLIYLFCHEMPEVSGSKLTIASMIFHPKSMTCKVIIMDMWNSHGKWGMPKPPLGGSARSACLLRNPEKSRKRCV